jgi:hypothetical protein
VFNRADGDPQQTSIVLGQILDQADVCHADSISLGELPQKRGEQRPIPQESGIISRPWLRPAELEVARVRCQRLRRRQERTRLHVEDYAAALITLIERGTREERYKFGGDRERTKSLVST